MRSALLVMLVPLAAMLVMVAYTRRFGELWTASLAQLGGLVPLLLIAVIFAAGVEVLVFNRTRAKAETGDRVTISVAREPEVRLSPELIALLGEAYLRTHAPREACGWLERADTDLRRTGDRAAMRKAIDESAASGSEEQR